jgi:hypothetical protein
MRPFSSRASFRSGGMESLDVSDGVHVVTGVVTRAASGRTLSLLARSDTPRPAPRAFLPGGRTAHHVGSIEHDDDPGAWVSGR